MAKELISYDELLEKIQGVLNSYPECQNIQVKGIQVYAEQIDDANWRIDWVGRSGEGNDWNECSQKIMDDIRILRTSFDVKRSK